ncbi:MAG TPA: HEAT repeat domain-containing protein [Marinagarivorans sp.]
MSKYLDPLLDSIATRLIDADPGIRRVAVLDLVDSPEEEAVELLIKALSDDDETVRMEAAKVIDEFDPRDMMDALVKALTSPDENVQNAAANALADLKDRSAAPALMEALKADDDPFVVAAILRSLKQLRIKEARPLALELLTSSDERVRREAVSLLGYLQEVENLPQLKSTAANDPAPEVRRTAIGALVFASAELVGQALIAGLKDENWQVRVEAAKGIGRLNVTAGADALVAATEDSMWQVQEKAAEAIGKIGAISSIPALLTCVKNPISNLRKAAVAAVGEIAHPDGLPVVAIALEDNDPDVRKLARWANERISTRSERVGE